MKQQLLRDEVLCSKGLLVAKARTFLVKDDFGNERQRFSEVYFIMGNNTPLDSVGFTPQEFQIVYNRFNEWLQKNHEV
jgi:hypothetical protein